MQTRAVIFDMDGLIIDTEPVWRRVEIDVFDRLGLHLTEEQCMETMGVRVADVVKLWHSRHPWHEPSVADVTRGIVQGVIDHVTAEGEPKQGVMRAIQEVHNAGLPIAIASSSSEEMIRAITNRLNITCYVDVIASADDEEKGKPDPAVYVSAARRLGIPSHACVALEDSPNGVLAAKAAGMYCIAVPDPYLATDPRMDQADVRIDTLEDFSLELLPGLAGLSTG